MLEGHKSSIGILSPNLQYAIAQTAPPLSLPSTVLYLKVIYTILPNGEPNLDHYGAKSGTYDITGHTIMDFVNGLLSGSMIGTLMSPIATTNPPPTPVIEYPCYVVYAINKNGLAQFRKELDAASTDDFTANEYVNLVHVQDDGSVFNGHNLTPITTPVSPYPCHILYFLASVSPSSEGQDDLPDAFNLYVNVLQSNNTYRAGMLDPDIKNTGHRLRGGGGGGSGSGSGSGTSGP